MTAFRPRTALATHAVENQPAERGGLDLWAGDLPLREAVARAGYKVGFTNATGATRIWPGRLGQMIPTDRFDISRLSTDRELSDAMFLAQMAMPRLAYIS